MASKGVLRIKIVGDDRDFKRKMQSAADNVNKFGKVLRAFGKTLAISSVIATAAVAAQGAAGAIGAITAAAVAASGSLLLLPGAALAGAVAFGALKIATSGFSDVLKNMSDPEAFAEALKTLPPSAQEAAKAIRDLKEPFDQLKESLQEKLFAGLGPQIRDVGRAMIDTLRPAFESISSSANRAISDVLAELGTLQSKLRVGLISDDAAQAFDNLAAAARPVVDALLDIGAVGASFLPGLTDGAGAAAQRFADLVARMRESGQLANIIQGGLDALRELKDLLVNVGSIIGTIFSAMQSAGGTTLGVLVQLTGEFRAFLKSAEGQQVLTTIFTTLRDLVDAVLPGVKALGGALMSAITDIAPALPGIGEAFSSIAESVAPLVETLGQLVGFLLPPLASFLEFLGPVAGPLAVLILGIAAAVKVWAIAQGLLMVVMSPTVVAVGLIIAVLAALVVAVVLVIKHWDKIKAVTAAVWGFIKGLIGAVWDWIVGKVTGAAATVVTTIVGAWARARAAVSSAWSAISNGVSNGINAMIGHVRSISGRILAALGNLGRLLYDAGRRVVQGLIDGIKAMIGAVGRAIGSVASKIRNALPFSPAKEGPLRIHPPDEAGRTIVDMISKGMRQQLPRLESTMGQVAGSVVPSLADLLRHSEASARAQLRALTAQAPGAASAGAAPGGALRVVFDVTGADEDLKRMFRKAVRNEGGGSAEKFFRAAR